MNSADFICGILVITFSVFSGFMFGNDYGRTNGIKHSFSLSYVVVEKTEVKDKPTKYVLETIPIGKSEPKKYKIVSSNQYSIGDKFKFQPE